MDKILLFLLCFYFCSAKIKINKLDVPSAILYDAEKETDVVLDCDFDSGGENVSEVKWFLNGNTQIYQWLPKLKPKGQAMGDFRENIDTEYKATNDEQTMYRALHITNVSPELSGNYTCKVSGFESEDVETKMMIIYDPADDDLELTISEETLEITCSAEGLYPKPNMTLYITTDNETEILYKEDDEISELIDGRYNVSSTLIFNPDELTDIFYYTCELNIPGTPFNLTETRIHELEHSSETQVEEDLSFLNSTNSTESSFEESTEIETQIEEESDLSTTTAETATNFDDDDVTKEDTKISEENASLRHLPILLPGILLIALLVSLYL